MNSVCDTELITHNFFQSYAMCSITLNGISIVCPFSLYFVTKIWIVFAVSFFKLGMERQFSSRKALILLYLCKDFVFLFLQDQKNLRFYSPRNNITEPKYICMTDFTVWNTKTTVSECPNLKQLIIWVYRKAFLTLKIPLEYKLKF